ncbi:MAG: hypothetical protein PVI86_09405 [Phycisphaerae bacterium]|jgi:hypothetical protein
MKRYLMVALFSLALAFTFSTGCASTRCGCKGRTPCASAPCKPGCKKPCKPGCKKGCKCPKCKKGAQGG